MPKAVFHFLSDGKLSSDFESLLSDKLVFNKFDRISDYLTENDFQIINKDILAMRKVVEKLLIDQVTWLSFGMYKYRSMSSEWGALNEFHHEQSMVSMYFSKENMGGFDFQTGLNEYYEKLGLNHYDSGQLYDQLSLFRFTLGSHVFVDQPAYYINQILRFIGSDLILMIDYVSKKMVALVGRGTCKKISGYFLYLIKEEISRCSDFVSMYAGGNGNRLVFIRESSIKTIFDQKWRPVLERNEFLDYKISLDPLWNISQGIKEKALALYNVTSSNDFSKKSKDIIKDITETISMHELGHSIVYHEILTPDQGSFGKSTKVFQDDDLLQHFMEFFADFSPRLDKLYGPMYNLVKISKKDRRRAEAMFYTYLSDVWFYDTEEHFMYTYSDFMIVIMLRYINDDQTINFERLEEDLKFSSDFEKSPNSMLERLYSLYIKAVPNLKKIMEEAIFDVADETLSYQEISKLWIKQRRYANPHYNIERLTDLRAHYANMIGFVYKFSKSKKHLQDFLKHFKEDTLKKMMILSCGRKKAEEYNYNHRHYIQERMLELGLTSKVYAE